MSVSAWGLAGLRLGMAFASEAIIDVYNKVKPPYNVNQATQELALAALGEVEQVNGMIRALVVMREELARDWRDARELLLSHRRFLRQELRALRQKSPWGRLVRAARALFTDQPALLLLIVGLLALLTALWFHWHH